MYRTLARHLAGPSFALMTLLGAQALANPTPAAFPNKPVHYIVPFAAGGLTDLSARQIGQYLAEEWKQPVVVENKPGGNANIGADQVARAGADGYTWLAVTLAHSANVTLFPKLPFNLQKDLVPVARIASSPMMVVVPANSPIKSMKDLAEAARKGRLTAGSSGNGTPPHLALALFERLTKSTITHIPYKGGAPSMTDLIGGQIDVVFSNFPESLQNVKGGKLRALAVTAQERHPLMPDVPTVAEAGFPDLIVENWTGVMMPAGTPPGVIEKVGNSVVKVLENKSARERIVASGLTPAPQASSAFTAYFRGEVARWATLIKEQGIQVD